MLERSSNELASQFLPGVVLPKPQLDADLAAEAMRKLPFPRGWQGVVGSGDYDHRKSSAGSAVLGHELGVVAKVPLGEPSEDAPKRTRKMQNSLRNFSKVSPDSLIIITEADGNTPKPVVVQKEVPGTPLCETPISDLLKLRTLRDIRKIVSEMRIWYWKAGSYDLCGQKTSNTFWGRLVPFAPSLSDNIMVDKSGRAFLVDNVLDSMVRLDTTRSKYKDFLRKNILHRIPLLIIDSLIVARRVYDFFKKERVEEAVPVRQPARV